MRTFLLPIHITAGLIALVAGAVALSATKGSPLHRRSGMVFAVAMLVMASLGSLIAIVKPDRGTTIGGLLTCYLVVTGFLAIRRTVEASRAWLTTLMCIAFAIAALDFTFGFAARQSADGRLDGLPAFPFFLFGFVALIGAIGDARTLAARSIEGTRRLARHLWRMTFAMWIATTSFFLGQAKVFPEPLRHAMGLRSIPVLLVSGMLVYWLVRVRIKRHRAVATPLTAAGTKP